MCKGSTQYNYTGERNIALERQIYDAPVCSQMDVPTRAAMHHIIWLIVRGVSGEFRDAEWTHVVWKAEHPTKASAETVANLLQMLNHRNSIIDYQIYAKLNEQSRGYRVMPSR